MVPGKHTGELLEAVIYVIIAIVIFSFILIHSLNKFDRTTPAFENTSLVMLEDASCVEQTVTVPVTCEASSVNILFETFGRTDEGVLTVSLFKAGDGVFTCAVPVSYLREEEYTIFKFDSLIHMEQGDEVTLRIEERYEGENGIAVCRDEEADSLCYTIKYPDLTLKRTFIIIVTLLFLFVVVSIFLHLDSRIIMSVMLVVLFAAYLWVCRPGMAPDESNHFCRAYEISEGGLISKHIGESGEGGNLLPANIRDYENRDAVLSAERAETTFGNASLYSPISYLPQVIGMIIMRLFTSKIFAVFYGGKIGNALCCLILCILAVYKAPFGKKLLFVTMTFPMALQEMVSIAPDGFTMALSFFFIALVFNLAYKEEKAGGKQLAALLVTGCIIALVKIVYIVLILLVFLIPEEKFRSRKNAFCFKIGSVCLAVILNAAWLGLASGYLVEFMPGVDSFAQIRYILTNISAYYMVVIRSFISALEYYSETMIGSLMGSLDIEISGIAWFITAVLLIFETCSCDVSGFRIRKIDSFILIFVFLSGVALIFTSLYVQWTPYMNSLINGGQGRYFTPLLPLLLFFAVFVRRKAPGGDPLPAYESDGRYCWLLILLANGITFLDIAHIKLILFHN